MPVFESTRKVQVFGSSLALTLPAMFVKANEIEKGVTLNVFYDLKGIIIVSSTENLKDLVECLTEIIDNLDKKGHPKGMGETTRNSNKFNVDSRNHKINSGNNAAKI